MSAAKYRSYFLWKTRHHAIKSLIFRKSNDPLFTSIHEDDPNPQTLDFSPIYIITVFTRRSVYCFELAEGAVLIRGQCLFWAVFINPRRACAERVTVVVSCVCVCVCLSVCLSVCMYVCLSEHAILAVRAIRSITKDAIVRFAAIIKRRFS